MINSGMLSDPHSLPPPSERLESWKERASYLKKGVRTVHRWERTEGLPVRRLGQDRPGLVFAYKAELDAWWLEKSRAAPHRVALGRRRKAPAASAAPRPRWRPAAILSILTLTVAAIVWIAIAWKPWRTAPIAYRPVPVTAEFGWAAQPSFSPDGRRIAYSWKPPQGRPYIQIKTIGADSSVRLTSRAESEVSPAWSPDGRFVAFLRSLDSKRVFGLMLVPAGGGQENQIAELTALGSLSWSADGKWLIATDGPPKAQSIVAISVTNGTRHVLTQPSEFGYVGAALSPDSRRLIFGSTSPRPSPIYELALPADPIPTREPRPAANDLFAKDLVVAPGANEVIFTDGSWEEGFDLWRLRLSPAAQPVRVYGASDRCFTPALSLDGRRLLFAVNRIHREAIWRK